MKAMPWKGSSKIHCSGIEFEFTCSNRFPGTTNSPNINTFTFMVLINMYLLVLHFLSLQNIVQFMQIHEVLGMEGNIHSVSLLPKLTLIGIFFAFIFF